MTRLAQMARRERAANPARRQRRRRRNERGAAAVIVAIFFTAVMIPLAAIGVDISRMYVEVSRVQSAADAAATAGVTFMPDDFEAAKARAIEISEDNGFPNSGASTVVVSAGNKPTQLRVTVSSTISNEIGKIFGANTTTVTRSALADFNGPAPMGSPCNTFANEPAGSPTLGPVGSVLKVPPFASCSTNPQFWGAITGPETHKTQGAEFETRKCAGVEDGCSGSFSGSTNEEFEPRGFIYMVRVNAAGVGMPITVQAYDPAYVDTGSACTRIPRDSRDPLGWLGGISSSSNSNYPQATSDAHLRYASGSNSFCSGDSDNNGNRFGSETPTVTSFAVRAPIDTLNPYAAPLQSTSCIKQFPGYALTRSGSLSTSMLRTGSSYNGALAKVFHQWVPICTFTPNKAGDWYVQVRNNVALPSGSPGSDGAYTGNMAVVNQTGDNGSMMGNGTNQFSLRAVTSAPAGAVSVASWERMRIFANADSATTTFNLVRVVPAAANKTLVISYFDVGEATGGSPGTVTVVPPTDAKLGSTVLTTLNGCVGSGVVSGSIPGCVVTNVTSARNNGKLQIVRVPIPSNYTCESSSQGGCWFRVRINFPGATVTDATTWTARIEGEPVRLLE